MWYIVVVRVRVDKVCMLQVENSSDKLKFVQISLMFLIDEQVSKCFIFICMVENIILKSVLVRFMVISRMFYYQMWVWSRLKDICRMLYSVIFSIILFISVENGDGVVGCVLGSQVCKGSMLVFVLNLNSVRMKVVDFQNGDSCWVCMLVKVQFLVLVCSILKYSRMFSVLMCVISMQR